MNLTSPTRVKSWCIDNGFHPNRALGQNFLIDRNALDAIINSSGLAKGMSVLEIGPGLGVLTEAMLKFGAEVTAVEKDRRLATRLYEALGSPHELCVIEADALKLDLDELLGRGFDACVSNLPYSVGTRILLDIALHPRSPAVITVLVQKEVAERFVADAGMPERSQVGVWLQLDFNVTIVRPVSAGCFWPRPEVGSCIVRLNRNRADLSERERETFFDLTRHAFTHRRKQIGASLRKARGELERSDEQIATALRSAGIDTKTRAEQISNADWKTLACIYARPDPRPRSDRLDA